MSASKILAAGPCDLAVLAELSAHCFAPTPAGDSSGTPWSARSLAEVMALPGVFGFLAMAGEAPVGFALAQAADDQAELLTLGVMPSARRSGYGRVLLREILAEAGRRGAARMTLEVADHNQGARKLYEDAGFALAGRRKNYYLNDSGRTTDAVILALSLVRGDGAGGDS